MNRHLLLIGGQRCGSTLLRELLDQHPEIAMARPVRPEPKVFLSDDLTGRGIAWYRKTYFAHAHDDQLLGDKSTSYLEDPQAPARARAMLGDETQIVAILRDPVERAVSNWRFSTDHGFENRTLEHALEENLDRERDWDAAASSVSPFAYLERGQYARQLLPWLEAFPSSHHGVLFDDVVHDDGATLAALLAGLGVSSSTVPALGGAAVNASTSPTPTVSATLARRLRDYFRPHDRDLADLLRREVPWST